MMLVDIKDLRKLAELAIDKGTQEAFIRVALQWADAANDEIVRLRSREATAQELLEALQCVVKWYKSLPEPGLIHPTAAVVLESRIREARAAIAKVDPEWKP